MEVLSTDSNDCQQYDNENLKISPCISQLSLTEEDLSSNSQDFIDNKLCFKLHKQIVKIPRKTRKGFVKKQFAMVPILLKEISVYNKYIIFGFQEIETYYKDYTNPYDMNLVNHSNSMVGIRSVETKQNNCNELQINVYSKGTSGLSDFQFIIDHFSKFTTQDYRYLHQNLIKYQEFVNMLKEHYQSVKMKLASRIISQEDIEKAKEDFARFVEKKVGSVAQEHYFYVYETFTLSPETMDIIPINKCVSLALLSLYGVEPGDYEQFLIHQGDIFQTSFGRDRMNKFLDFIEFYINGNTFKKTTTPFKTLDNIRMIADTDLELVYWDERPEWASKYDFMLTLCSFDIAAEKLKEVIDYRQNRTKQDLDMEYLEASQLDYVIQSEIFLEKFYPDIYKNHSTKKSMRRIINKITPVAQNSQQPDMEMENEIPSTNEC